MSQPRPNLSSTTTPPPRTPRWVMVLGIIVIVLVLLVGIVMLTGLGGPHGPMRHAPPTSAQQP